MKNKKTMTEAYLTQKETPILDAVFVILTAVGVVLTASWLFLYIGIGFLGLPILIVGGLGLVMLRTSKTTDEDFDAEVKRVLKINGVEENDSTLKEFIVGKSDHIKRGKDKKIRTAYYCVTVFEFKKESCKVKKHVVDLFAESVSCFEYLISLGKQCKINEREYTTAIGTVSRSFLEVEGESELVIPVNVNVYDTEAVVNRLKHKR
ncbi:MAG: hypothetical protein E7615_03915 [Ruminococcaceae bacterium]|nr:hypothetical protein [Oscillospiraceae bacterium]